jgi:hypothetical protein
MTDENDVAALRACLAEQLRTRALNPRIPGTAAPLKQAADYVECLALDHGPLVALTASETRAGTDGFDTFDLGPGWLLIGRYDPRTTSLRQLILGIIETNLEDELAELDDDDQQGTS